MSADAKDPHATPAQPGMRRAVTLVSAGAIVGLLEVALAASYAALVFSGPLQKHLPDALGVVILGAAVVAASVSLLGSTAGVIGAAQNIPAAVLAAVGASVLAELPANGDATFATVALAVAVSAAVAGALFLGLGALRLGNLVRFVPYPVVGGFIAGSGWLLLMGSLGVLTGTSRKLAQLPELIDGDILWRWLPELVFVAAIIFISKRSRSYLLVPGALIAGTALFYAVIAVQGTSASEAQAAGLLLGPLPDQGIVGAWTGSALAGADLGVLASQMPAMISLTVAALLQLLLNASGMELILERDIDLNKELRAAGAANILIGATGGIAGYQSLSLTTLAARVARPDRMAGVVAAVFCLVVLVAGRPLLALFPRAALGGLLMFVGLTLLIEWLFEARERMPRAEHLIVFLIAGVMAVTSFLPGVLVGIVAATVLFVVNYSRQDVVKHELSGSFLRSHVERSGREIRTLRREGASIHVMELQGFLFFGTSHSLFERIRARQADGEPAPLRFLVIDMRRVDGLDSSAVLSFGKTLRLARSSDFHLVVTGMDPAVRDRLQRGGITELDPHLHYFDDLDHGLQFCEDTILTAAQAQDSEAGDLWERVLGGDIDHDDLLPYLERLEIGAGEELIRQGDPAGEIYFLESGHMTAVLRHDHEPDLRLRTMRPGTVVGEVGVYLGDVRSASVIADEPCVVHRLAQSSLRAMEERSPQLAAGLHRALARLLAERLVDLTAAVDELRD